MSLSEAKFAYEDCFRIWEQAAAAGGGCRVQVSDEGMAINLRMRLHQARKIDRRENAKIYPDENHPMCGNSLFDGLAVRILCIDGEWWLYIEPRGRGILKLETFDQPQNTIGPGQSYVHQVDHIPQRQLPPPTAIKRRKV